MRKINFLKIILLNVVLYTIFIRCNKSTEPTTCTPVNYTTELDTMKNYLIKKNISFTQHNMGFLYKIIDTGSGDFIKTTNTVSVVYTGKFLNDVKFDAVAAPVSFGLSTVIVGWQYALQLIKNKGHIIVLLPSYLSYGCEGMGSIPPNSPLFFDITVSNIIN